MQTTMARSTITATASAVVAEQRGAAARTDLPVATRPARKLPGASESASFLGGTAVRVATTSSRATKASRPASTTAQAVATATAPVQTTSYSQDEVQNALEFIERQKQFPANYYTQIKLNLGQCFANTNKTVPSHLGAKDFTVDYSTLSEEKAPPEIIEDALRIMGIRIYRRTDRNATLAQIRQRYSSPAAVELENKIWWVTHCQALRDGDKKNRMFTIDGVTEEYSGLTVLFNEYRDELMYFTKDSLYDVSEGGITNNPDPQGLKGYWYGRTKGNTYESSWWAMLANPRVRMTWPRVTFSGEDVSFDWVCFDVNTSEMTAFGDVVWIRTGDVGGCYKKYEHLYFLRDVYKPFFDQWFGKDGGAAAAIAGAYTPPAKGQPGYNTDMVKRLFSRGEASDSAGFITFFTDTPLYQFGNFEIATSKDAIFKSAENFFNNISAVYHDIKRMWEHADCVFVEMDVTYWRLDGSVVTLPCFDIFRVDAAADKFSELRIFMDVNPVFDPSIPVPSNATVFTGASAQKLAIPGTMMHHFATHPEAQDRIKNGLAPKWSYKEGGPKWQIRAVPELPAEPPMPTPAVLPGTYTDMVKRLFSRGEASDSAGFITFFTETPVYQFGNFEVALSKDTIFKSAEAFFSGIKAVYHEIKMIWEDGYTVFVEMDVIYWRLDGTKVQLPCADIFRVDPATGKFSELRIFMDCNPVFNAALPVGHNASVLTAAGTTLTPPETMKHHFAEHPEGKLRVLQGYAPKWSTTDGGPKWPIGKYDYTVSAAMALAMGDTAAPAKAEPEGVTLAKVLFSRGEAHDHIGFVTFFTDTPVYQFGNFEVALNKDAIGKSGKNFFDSIKAVYHDIKEMWQVDECVYVEMDVMYWRLDGSLITLPCMDIFRVDAASGKFSELRIFMDVNPVFDPSIPVPDSASVFTIAGGARMPSPGTMKTHFASYPEAQERIKNGFAPKWSVNPGGPMWPIQAGSGKAASTATPSVAKGTYSHMAKRLFTRGESFDSKGFTEFFTDNPIYQFGNFEVEFAKDGIFRSAEAFFSGVKAVYHDVKSIKESGYTVFVEMDVWYWRLDGSLIVLPCGDIFRVDPTTGKFSELRIFMDVNPVFDKSIAVPNNSTVFTAANGVKLPSPGTMKHHFAEDPEAQQRVITGAFPPKWSTNPGGPMWPIGHF
eukprot:jgi/Chlat1/3675/Chrsp24S03849